MQLARNNRKLEEHMRAEIAIMKSLHHENIVQLLDAITVRAPSTAPLAHR